MDPELKELIVRVLIVIVTVTWGVMLWRTEVSEATPNFTWRNLISNKEGYPDRVAIMEIGAWLAMTAVIIIAVLRSAHELATLCGIYVGAFTLRGGTAAWTKAANPPIAGISRTTQSERSSTVVTQPEK